MAVGGDLARELVAGRGARGRLGAASTVLAVTLLASGTPTSPEEAYGGSSAATTPPTGLTVSVDRDGSYTITTQTPCWSFAGSVGYRLAHITITDGRDTIGSYRETDFTYQATVARRSGIRAYTDKPVVVFTTAYLADAPNSEPFPILGTYPRLPYHLSYQDAAFSPYRFNGGNAGDSPWLYFDTQAHGFLLSAASDFQIADTATNADGSIVAGIAPSVTTPCPSRNRSGRMPT